MQDEDEASTTCIPALSQLTNNKDSIEKTQEHTFSLGSWTVK